MTKADKRLPGLELALALVAGDRLAGEVITRYEARAASRQRRQGTPKGV